MANFKEYLTYKDNGEYSEKQLKILDKIALSEESISKIKAINKEINIFIVAQVFCPDCRAVVPFFEKFSELNNKIKITYSSRDESQDILKEITNLKKIKDEYIYLNSMYEEIQMILEFIEMGDNSFESDLEEKINILENEIDNFKIKLLLDEKYDSNNAILTINSGAGGTEACDWAEMLYRLYDRWANKKDFKVEILDSLVGEEAGLKSITH